MMNKLSIALTLLSLFGCAAPSATKPDDATGYKASSHDPALQGKPSVVIA